MSAASDYLENALMNAVFRGEAYPSPSNTYIALHTAGPGETGMNEVMISEWPSYIRVEAENGAGSGAGWTNPVNGEIQNMQKVTFPAFDGVSSLQIAHWSIWDASVGGNMLVRAPLDVKWVLPAGGVAVFDINSLTVQLA